MLKKIHKLLIIFTLVSFSCDQPEVLIPESVALNSLIDSTSYAIGFQNGNQLGSLDFDDVNYEAYIYGFNAGVLQQEQLIPDSELRTVFASFNEFLRDRIVYKNKLEEDEFFAKNLQEEGVIETESGLQYKVITEGEGAKPFAQNTISVMYEGRLIDGTIFDSNYTKGEPSEFVLGQVIPGWIEGIQLMSVGSTYEFYIPNKLAYGETPRPGSPIMPGDALIFKVELLEIVQ